MTHWTLGHLNWLVRNHTPLAPSQPNKKRAILIQIQICCYSHLCGYVTPSHCLCWELCISIFKNKLCLYECFWVCGIHSLASGSEHSFTFQWEITNQSDHISLSNSMKLWAMPRRTTQDRRLMVVSSDKTWSPGEGNGKLLLYALRTPWTVWKSKKIGHWNMNSPGQ